MATPGILCVLPRDPTVDATFPMLSATRLPHTQEIRLFRGDSFRIGVRLQDDADPPNTVSLAGALIRFSVKQGFGSYVQPQLVGNDAAMIRKASTDPNQIVIKNEASGLFQIYIDESDTYDHPVVPAVWDIEITRPDPERAPVSRGVTVVSGMSAISPFDPRDTFPSSISRGHLVSLQGRLVRVVRRISDRHVEVDGTDWTTEPNATAVFTPTLTRTVASGDWICAPDVSL